MTRLTDHQIDVVLTTSGSADWIAFKAGVSVSTVYNVKRLLTGRAMARDEALRAEGVKVETWPPARPKGTLDPEKVDAIRASDEPSPVVAQRYGISAAMVRMIRTGRAYR